MKTAYPNGPRGLWIVKLLLALTVSVASFSATAKGGNWGGGGDLYSGPRPTRAQVIDYLKGWSAPYVLGNLYSGIADGAATNPSPNAEIRARMAQKIAAGLRIEIRTDEPCYNQFDEPAPSSIVSQVADICLNVDMFATRERNPVNPRNFPMHLDGLLLHEITHLAQMEIRKIRGNFEKISSEEEDLALRFQADYLETSELGERPSLFDLGKVNIVANEILKIRNGKSKLPPLRLNPANEDEARLLCDEATAISQMMEPLVLKGTGIIINNVHLVGPGSDYWMRWFSNWRAAFKSKEELAVLTEKVPAKEYELPPSFIGIAKIMQSYHCTSDSKYFSNWQEQTYGSKEAMYNTYRDLMMKQLSLMAEKSLEVLQTRFTLVPAKDEVSK